MTPFACAYVCWKLCQFSLLLFEIWVQHLWCTELKSQCKASLKFKCCTMFFHSLLHILWCTYLCQTCITSHSPYSWISIGEHWVTWSLRELVISTCKFVWLLGKQKMVWTNRGKFVFSVLAQVGFVKNKNKKMHWYLKSSRDKSPLLDFVWQLVSSVLSSVKHCVTTSTCSL